MRPFNWFEGVRQQKRRPKAGARPRIECLECRDVPAIVIEPGPNPSINDGLLSVVGTAGADVVVVEVMVGREDDLVVTVYDRLTGAVRETRNELDPEDDDFNRITLSGLAGDDVLINWSKENAILMGGAGADVLQGGFANDTLIGGNDSDQYVYSTSPVGGLPGGVVVNDVRATPGVPYGDQLGADRLASELFERGLPDVVDFQGLGVSAQLDLTVQNTAQAVAPGRLALTLANVPSLSHVIGTPFDDVLRGNASANLLIGGDGNDVLEGRGGDDFLFGQSGADTYVFRTGVLGHDFIQESSLGVTAGPDVLDLRELDRGANVDLSGVGRRMTLATGVLDLTLTQLGQATSNGIEDVLGTRFDDFLFGNDLSNRLEGNRGNDTLFGQGGRDTLIGGFGTDSLYGGQDDDQLYGFVPLPDGPRIQGEAANDVLDGGEGTDRLEWWIFTGRVLRRLVVIE